MIDDNVTNLLVAVISGLIPGLFALRQASRANRSVKLAGSDVTIANWNKLIANLYSEIDRLTQLNERERSRASAREHELVFELEAVRITAAKEKAAMLEEIRILRDKLAELEDRVSKTLGGVDDLPKVITPPDQSEPPQTK